MTDSSVREKPKPKLDDLFQRGAVIEDSELASALIGKITLAEGTDRVFLAGDFQSQSVQRKLVAAGLARHALRRKQALKSDEELARSVEWYANQVQENPKTVAQELSRLKKKGLFDRTDQGYLVPLWALKHALDALAG